MAVATQKFLSSRARWLVFVLLIGVAVYLLAVTPARTYFEQRSDMAAAEQRYESLQSANQELTQRAAALQDDATVAQLARDRYELVPNGGEAFAVMPPADSVTAPAVTEPEQQSWFAKTRDTLSFWN